jgi:UDP-3-O-[3-hydroxymyristoyl] glucosamine N-acyltransferase
MTAYTLGQLARRFDLDVHGDPEQRVSGLATLSAAGPEDLGFLANAAYAQQLGDCRAGALILAKNMLERWTGNALVTSNPYAAWARVAALMTPRTQAPTGIHASAWVDPDAQVDPSAAIGPQCSIAAGCRIGAGVEIGPGCVVEAGAVVGDRSRLVGRVFIGEDVQIGQRVLIHPGAVIGADGFGLALDQGRWLKVPQMGSVQIGDDCEIGANTTIDCGAIEDTVLEEDVRIDNQVQVAHNVHIGAHTAIAGCVGIAGSTRIGRYCMIAGACGIGGHLTICDQVIVTAMSTVVDSIDEPGEYGSGIPARPHARWKRILVRLGQLDDWARRLRRLENK